MKKYKLLTRYAQWFLCDDADLQDKILTDAQLFEAKRIVLSFYNRALWELRNPDDTDPEKYGPTATAILFASQFFKDNNE